MQDNIDMDPSDPESHVSIRITDFMDQQYYVVVKQSASFVASEPRAPWRALVG